MASANHFLHRLQLIGSEKPCATQPWSTTHIACQRSCGHPRARMGKKKKGKAKGKGKGKGKGSGAGKKKAEPAVTAEGKARDGPAAIADLCVALKLPRKVVSDVCASNASTVSMPFGELLEDGAPQRGAAEEEQGSAVAPPPSGPSEVGLGRYMKKGAKAELYADDFSDDDDDVFSMGEGKGMTSCDVGSDQLICRFNTRTPASLVQGLRMSGRGVTMVDLSNNTLEGDVAGVCAALSDHCPRLTFLDLSDNGLDDASGAAVAELMVTRGNVVRRLVLRNNQLTEVFAKQLADALLSRSGVQLLHVDLRRNRVGPGGGVAMGRLLGTLPDMTHVDLGWNELRCDGAAALLAGFSQLCATGWSTPHLQQLDLSWNGLDDGVGEAFGDLLENSKSLTSLVIDHNRFGEATGLAVARGLVANEHLLYFKIGFNPLGRRATREIIEALRSNTTVANEVLRRIFELPAPGDEISSADFVITPNGDAVVMGLDQVNPGEYKSLPEAEQDQLQRILTGEYGNLVYHEYQRGLRENAEITVL